jgi:hypothetical protein
MGPSVVTSRTLMRFTSTPFSFFIFLHYVAAESGEAPEGDLPEV